MPEAVADRAVGGRAPPLHEDVLLPRVVHDVPDDEEVAGEIELLDQIELAGDLRARLVAVRTVALARPHLGDLAQERDLRPAVGHRVLRKAVAQVGHRVFEPLGERRGARQRIRTIGKQLRHRLGRLQIPLRIPRQQPSRRIERRLVAHARQHVEQRTVGRLGESHTVGGNDRDAKRLRQRIKRGVVGFLISQQMALQLDEHVAAAEQADQPIEQAADAVSLAVEERTAAERDEPGGAAVELLEHERALPFPTPPRFARRGPRGEARIFMRVTRRQRFR